MITHIVTFRFAESVDAASRQAVLDELQTFPSRFPAMQRWRLGANQSRRDDTFTHAFVVEFAAEEDLLRYLGSEAHEEFVRNRWKPVIASRAITSFEH